MSGCTLRFERNSPLRTALVDQTTGHAKYKIETPLKITRSVTRIRKFRSPTQPALPWDGGADSGSGKERGEIGTGLARDEPSDEIARVYWKSFSPDRIIFKGRVTTRSESLPKSGKLRGGFTFTGPDGVQYRWALGATGLNPPKLVTADSKKTVIAEFRHAQHLINKQKAKLDVKLAGMDMLDYIVMTFVIVEQARRERLGWGAKCM